MMLGREAAAIGIAHHRAVGDRQQHIVSGIELGVGEIGIVGRDQRQIVLVGEVDQRGLDAILRGQPVPHQLDIDPAREQRPEAQQHGFRSLALAFREQPPGCA